MQTEVDFCLHADFLLVDKSAYLLHNSGMSSNIPEKKIKQLKNDLKKTFSAFLINFNVTTFYFFYLYSYPLQI